MSRIIPHPALSASLLVMWLLLQQSVSPGQVLLGTIVAILAGQSMQALQPEKVRIRRPWLFLKLACIVIYDIVRSNIAVARIILTKHRRGTTAGFMVVPLELRHHIGLAMLAIIITATPGTVWLEYEPETGRLLIHVLDLVDERHWVDIIKNRYERLLLEIFA